LGILAGTVVLGRSTGWPQFHACTAVAETLKPAVLSALLCFPISAAIYVMSGQHRMQNMPQKLEGGLGSIPSFGLRSWNPQALFVILWFLGISCHFLDILMPLLKQTTSYES